MEAGWAALHERFLSTLRTARTFEAAVALRLFDAGLSVRLGERREAPSLKDAGWYSDNGDLVVEGRWVVEVKSSTYPFTGPADWPFSHGAYVTSVKRWRSQRSHPIAFVFVSQHELGMVAISTATADLWGVHTTSHPDRPAYEVLCAPPESLRPMDHLVTALVARKATL